MIISPEQQKANTEALYWLANELRNIKFEQLIDANARRPMPGIWSIGQRPIGPEDHKYWNHGVFIWDGGFFVVNPFLRDALALIGSTPEGYERLVVAADWLGVWLRKAGDVTWLIHAIAEKLAEKVDDGKDGSKLAKNRNILQLVADAIIPEPLTKREKKFVEIGEFINTLPFETQESRKEMLKAIADEFSKENKDIGRHTFTCQKRKASDALVWLEKTGRYQSIYPRRGRNKPTKNDLQMAYQKVRQMEGRRHT
jgi:hypothetical protein